MAKEQKLKIFNRAFLGSHTSNLGEIPLGYIRPLEIPTHQISSILRGSCAKVWLLSAYAYKIQRKAYFIILSFLGVCT